MKSKIFRKLTNILLVITLLIPSLANNVATVQAASFYREGTLTLAGTTGITVDFTSAGLSKNGYIYDMRIDGNTGFCLDLGKHAQHGQMARVSTVTGSTLNAIWNYVLNDDLVNSYLQSTPGVWSGNNRAAAQALIWAYEEGVSVQSAGIMLRKVIECIWPGIGAAPDWVLEEWAQNAFNYSDRSGTLYIYDSGSSANQRILTSSSGTMPTIRYNDVDATETVSKDDSIDIKIEKTDVETGKTLENVQFDIYRDDEKLASVKTDKNGKASYTFTTTFSRTVTSSTKTYCSNYDDLSTLNKKLITTYTSKAKALAAAEAEAKEKAEDAVDELLNTKHTYKIVETQTRDEYYLNPNSTVYTKSYASGDGTGQVSFTVTNHRQTGSISLVKFDSETGNTVKDATYQLFAGETVYHPDGKTGILYEEDDLVATFPATDADGKTKLSDLYLGKYYIIEKYSPDGYVVDENRYEVVLEYEGQTVEVATDEIFVEDTIQRGQITITKVDEELNAGKADSSVVDFDNNGSQGDADLQGALYGLYAKNDITHPDGKTGVITYNAKADDIYEIQLTKGTDLTVYEVDATKDTLIATALTDENGQIEFSHLLLGDYYVKEITPSEGYLLNETVYDVSLEYAGQDEEISYKKKTVFETVKRQAFEIYKGGHTANTSTNATPLENVHFEVKLESDIQSLIAQGMTLEEAKLNAPLYDELITDKEGKATSIELPYGLYRVMETVPSKDYSTADDFFVNVTEDSRTPQDYSNNVIIDEVFTAYLKLVKKDSETGKTVLLTDTTFKIKALSDVTFNGKKFEAGDYIEYFVWDISEGFWKNTWTTDDTGTVLLNEKLSAGTYELCEISSPYGYLLDSEPVQFTITNETSLETAPDGNPIITAVKYDLSVKGIIEVEKTGEQLSGITTDEYGNIQFVYTEQGVDGAQFNIIADEDIYSADNQKDIIYNKNDIVETVTTVNGHAESSELPLGKYRVEETVAGNGFVLNTEPQYAELTYEDQYTALVFNSTSFVNERQKFELETEKQDIDTHESLSGATFGLYASEDIYAYSYISDYIINDPLVEKGTLIETVTTDETGKVKFSADLPVNYSFEIRELNAPVGYASTEYSFEFKTDYQGQDTANVVFTPLFENEITKIEVSKKDITNDEEISGAFLAVYAPDANEFIDAWTSGSDGYNEDGTIKPHLIKGLEVGKTYRLEEIIAPYGYAVANEVEFTVLDTGEIQSVEMKDEMVFGQLKWTKTGEIFNQSVTGATEFGATLSPVWNVDNLSGAEITIYAAQDITIGNHTYYKADEVIETLTSSADEEVLSSKLPVGQYYYLETKTPNGYITDTNKHYFRVLDTRVNELQVITSTLENTRPTFDIDMTKVLEEQNIFLNEEAYKDIVFGIYAKEDIINYYGDAEIPAGSLIATSGIDENGHLIDVPDLPFGIYYIKELATNSQYVLNDTEYEFELIYQGEDVSKQTVVINNGTIENELARGQIKVIKKDSFDEEKILANVKFNISVNEDMSDPFTTAETNENGTALFDNLELGTYYIQEAEQVDGYVLNNHIYKVEVTKDGDILEIVCENKPTEMIFSKQDFTTSEELPGAHIEIRDAETNEIIDEWISTTEPHIIRYLVEGKEYIMTETTAPEGYDVAESITFTAKDGEKIVMKDTLTPTAVKTGDNSNIAAYTGLTALSGLAFASMIILKKKKEEQNEQQ